MASDQICHLILVPLTVHKGTAGDIKDKLAFIIIKVLEDNSHIIQIKMVRILERKFHVQRIVFRIEEIISQISILPAALVIFTGIKCKQRVRIDHF